MMDINFTRLSFLFIFSFFIALGSKAQDARFSQINASPLLLNPAMTGVYKGQFRFIANYRELYASVLQNTAFRTISSSFEVKVPVQNKDFAGIGLNIIRDEVGLAQFNRLQANIGGSFLKQLDGGRFGRGTQYLVLGGQVGFGQRGFDFGNLWFTSQYDEKEAIVNFDAQSGEDMLMDNNNTGVYVNFNAGILWYTIFDDNASFYLGGAMHHINAPNISFVGTEDEVLERRIVAHAGGELPVSKDLSILPALAFFNQGPSMSTTLGGNLRYTNKEWNEVAMRFGGWMHFSNKLESGFLMDAFVVNAIIETGKVNIGLSYDITTSSLTDANNARGAFEISLIYLQPENRKTRLECPKY